MAPRTRQRRPGARPTPRQPTPDLRLSGPGRVRRSSGIGRHGPAHWHSANAGLRPEPGSIESAGESAVAARLSLTSASESDVLVLVVPCGGEPESRPPTRRLGSGCRRPPALGPPGTQPPTPDLRPARARLGRPSRPSTQPIPDLSLSPGPAPAKASAAHSRRRRLGDSVTVMAVPRSPLGGHGGRWPPTQPPDSVTPDLRPT